MKGPSKKKALECFRKIVKFFAGGKIEGAEFIQKKLFEGLISEQDKEGNTPMHLATIEGHYYLTSKLKDGASQCGGVDLNATNNKGFTIMDNLLLRKMLKSWITVCSFCPDLLNAVQLNNL